MSETIVIGAGITGLSFALHSKRPAVILEKEERPGGLCGSVAADGFTFDYSGHFLHLRRPENVRLVRRLMKGNLRRIERRAWIYLQRRYIPYPFQASLHALPERIKKECLKGFMRRPPHPLSPSADFYHWSLATFGAGITRHFMKPYNEKLWTIPARRLSADWAAPFVPVPTPEEIVDSAERQPRREFGYNASFYYPEHGGSQALIDALAAKAGDLRLKTEVVRVNFRSKYVETAGGKRLYYRSLVSTQPLPELLKQMPGLPGDVATAARKLAWNSVTCYNLGVRREGAPAGPADGKHWVYFPEKRFVFYRAGIYSNVSPSSAPGGYRSFYAEVSHRPGRPPAERMSSSVTAGLRRCGLLSAGGAVEADVPLSIPYAYVIYDRYRSGALSVLRPFLASHGIHSIGRYGRWEYSFMERSIDQGRETARIIDGKCQK